MVYDMYYEKYGLCRECYEKITGELTVETKENRDRTLF